MSDMTKYDLPAELTVTADGPLRVVTFNRPDDLNAVNKNLHWALANVWRQLAADLEAKVVILTGAGRAFSAGGDLDWITSFLDDRAAGDESLREGAQIIEEVLRFPLPVIAAVNGPAVGIGCSLALASDLIIASRSAYFLMAFVNIGLGLDGGASHSLVARVGHARAFEIGYLGERITADTALRLSRFFSMSEGFWMNLQDRYDREIARVELGDILPSIKPLADTPISAQGRVAI